MIQLGEFKARRVCETCQHIEQSAFAGYAQHCPGCGAQYRSQTWEVLALYLTWRWPFMVYLPPKVQR